MKNIIFLFLLISTISYAQAEYDFAAATEAFSGQYELIKQRKGDLDCPNHLNVSYGESGGYRYIEFIGDSGEEGDFNESVARPIDANDPSFPATEFEQVINSKLLYQKIKPILFRGVLSFKQKKNGQFSLFYKQRVLFEGTDKLCCRYEKLD